MSVTIKAPTVAVNVSDWSFVDEALSLDNHVASSSANPTVDTFKVKTFGGASIPGSDVIFGIEVEIWAAYQTSGIVIGGAGPVGPPSTAKVVPDGKFVRLRAQLSKNSTVRVGSDRVLPCPATLTNIVFGGPTDLWGTTWAPADFNSSNFTVFIEKPYDLADEWETDRYVDFARILVYHGEAGGGGIMPAHDKVRDICLIGKEVTPGTLVSTPIRLRKGWIDLQPDPSITEIRAAGEKAATDEVTMREKSSGTIKGRPCYDEIGYFLASRVKKPATSTIGTGLYRHVFREANFSKDDIQTFSMEEGDLFTQARRAAFGIVTALELNIKHDDIDLGGAVMARDITPIAGTAMSRGVATVQTVAIGSTGTYRLRYMGEETSDLTEASTTSAIQTALRALPTIGGSTELVVAGTPTNYTVTFGNAAAGPFKGIPQPILDYRVVSGGVTVGVTMTTAGGYTTLTGVPILPGHIEVFFSDTYATLAANKVAKGFVSNVAFAERATPVFYLDRAVQSFGDYAEPIDFGLEVTLELEEDSNAMAYLTNARANTLKFMRILATGPDVTVGNPHTLQIDIPVKISNWGPYGENQAISAFTYHLKNMFDPARNEGVVVTLTNGVSAY